MNLNIDLIMVTIMNPIIIGMIIRIIVPIIILVVIPIYYRPLIRYPTTIRVINGNIKFFIVFLLFN